MAIIGNSRLRRVTGISSDDGDRILDFLQGAVYCWCKNRPAEWFSLRDLMGGENFHWQGTPLIVLWQKHSGRSLNPIKEAGKDAGCLLKAVIGRDPRTFRTREAPSQIREYQWDATVPVPHE